MRQEIQMDKVVAASSRFKLALQQSGLTLTVEDIQALNGVVDAAIARQTVAPRCFTCREPLRLGKTFTRYSTETDSFQPICYDCACQRAVEV